MAWWAMPTLQIDSCLIDCCIITINTPFQINKINLAWWAMPTLREVTNPMNLDSFKNKIRYITNEQGIKTDVLIPLVIWDNILEALNLETSQDTDSKTELIADLKQSLLDAQEGKTFPLEELWQDIEQ